MVGATQKAFAQPAFGQHSPRLLPCKQVTISVEAVLTESCLATSNFSGNARTALCGLCKRKPRDQSAGTNSEPAPLTAGWWAGCICAKICLRPSATMRAYWLYPKALINNTKLSFRPPVFCDERYLSKNCCQCLGYSHVPMPCLFVMKWNNCCWARLGFTLHLLRENKASKLQMCFLGNPRFPKVSLHIFLKRMQMQQQQQQIQNHKYKHK